MATALPVLYLISICRKHYLSQTLVILFLKHEKCENHILDSVVRLYYASAGSDTHMQIYMGIYI